MTDTPNAELPAEIRQLAKDDEETFDAYRLKANGCDVVVATYPQGLVIESHRHDDVSIVGVVTAGRVHLTVAGVDHTYSPGDWFHVPISAEHSARYESTTTEVEFMFPA